MRTNDVVIDKVKSWLSDHNKSYQWLADQLLISKSLVGHMLSGERTLQPERIRQLADLMDVSVMELVSEGVQDENLSVNLRGSTSNRRSKRDLEHLLFAIEDYIGLAEQVRK
ncbi:XRE family transcriptional regulator [Jeotgalibacillus sp. R-1-5s-1]|nr:XRE family transcriptional regulator [Jeotgalibacillus sp. R-1-5s-1]